MIFQGEFSGTTLVGTELYELYGLSIFLAAMAIYRHRANIKRLLNGTENKLSFGKRKE